MTPGTPADFEAFELRTVGCASLRTAGDGRELWRFADEDHGRVERLSRLARRGVFGFTEAGRDEQGQWLLRSAGVPSLRDAIQARRGAWPLREVLELASALARALAACEKHDLLPGAITPDRVALTAEGRFAHLRADSLLRELVGATPQAPETLAQGVPARWLPPEQAGTEVWDARANRYVLGLIVYRLISGEHAFKAHGLRLGFEEQRSAGAPPFADDIARSLPPGLQSLCLQLLHRDAAERPPSARNIERRLLAFLDATRAVPGAHSGAAPAGGVIPAVRTPAPVENVAGVSVNAAAARAAPGRRRVPAAAFAPLLAAVACAGWLAFGTPGAPSPAARLEQRPLSQEQTGSEDCAQCHTRHVAEWRRSVMAHSAQSPLFLALEMLIQEQVGRSTDCPEGAGVLRGLDPSTACRDRGSGLPVTGSGGELWCVNCHAPAQNLSAALPAWDATALGGRSRRPLSDLLSQAALEGINCAFCHETVGPAHPARSVYRGNPSWLSPSSGRTFSSRPEDARGRFGIANSGYALEPSAFLLTDLAAPGSPQVHARTPPEVRAYRASSEFCGTCHDVRLFGTDVLGANAGEHFKRLRNAYSEWRAWADSETQQGRTPASCQGCHMSTFPGVCAADGAAAPRAAADAPTALARACPPGTHFEPRAPYAFAEGRAADNAAQPRALYSHYFSGVDLPLASEVAPELLDDPTLDSAGTPLGARQRRDLLLASSVRLALGTAAARGARLEVPVTIENVGAGHRVPAGFSQERELWVHLRVTDGEGRVVYEVGRVESATEDLPDKRFLRVNVDETSRDASGRPLGMFGADVADGPDAPSWIEQRAQRSAARAEAYRGRGLINFQNGFLRCVTCIGRVDQNGRCQPLPGQERARGDRFADGDYDPETGACRGNLFGEDALFETYFPVGALDASRGVLKAPDAIIDTRSLAPGVPRTYTYVLDVPARAAPFRVEARLLFRAFPPFLLRAFIAYERLQEARGRRPSGPLIGDAALERLDIVELARASRVAP